MKACRWAPGKGEIGTEVKAGFRPNDEDQSLGTRIEPAGSGW